MRLVDPDPAEFPGLAGSGIQAVELEGPGMGKACAGDNFSFLRGLELHEEAVRRIGKGPLGQEGRQYSVSDVTFLRGFPQGGVFRHEEKPGSASVLH